MSVAVTTPTHPGTFGDNPMKEADIPLVRGGKLTHEMIAWIDNVLKHFPGVERELVTIRKKPITPPSPRQRDRYHHPARGQRKT
jgi:hypothetical protein